MVCLEHLKPMAARCLARFALRSGRTMYPVEGARTVSAVVPRSLSHVPPARTASSFRSQNDCV